MHSRHMHSLLGGGWQARRESLANFQSPLYSLATVWHCVVYPDCHLLLLSSLDSRRQSLLIPLGVSKSLVTRLSSMLLADKNLHGLRWCTSRPLVGLGR